MRCEDGSFGRATVPSGASTGEREALKLQDGDGSGYAGKGVLRGIGNIRDETAPAALGLDAADRDLVDRTMAELNGTEMESRLGANSI